jgi:hypothetical protein
LAEEQGQWIDAHVPGHRLARQNGTTAGQPNIFALAARHAESMLLALQFQQEVKTLNRVGAAHGAG